jgi:hypothetical protein
MVEERTYWYLGKGPIDVPYWTDVISCETKFEGKPILAPMLFTAREKVEAELRWFNEHEPDENPRAIEVWGEDSANRGLDNTPPTEIFAINKWLLGEYLNDSAISCVVVDHEVKLVQDLLIELK